MRCEKCGRLDNKVIETRRLVRTVFRRRECIPCGERWWTQEAMVNGAPGGIHEMAKEVASVKRSAKESA